MTPAPRRLPMKPTRAFATLMAMTNRDSYAAASEAVSTPAPKALLEIGFGAGAWIERTLKRFPDCMVTGIDPTHDAVALAQFKPTVRRAGARVSLLQTGVEDLPFASGSFDAIVAIHSFQFWSDPHRALMDLGRVARQNGKIVLVLRNHDAGAPAWLPNPISRSGQEVAGTCAALGQSGWQEVTAQQRKGFSVVCGVRPGP
jgi:ubiquinone/menaquinone biosynthesis C-methylase UbiE